MAAAQTLQAVDECLSELGVEAHARAAARIFLDPGSGDNDSPPVAVELAAQVRQMTAILERRDIDVDADNTESLRRMLLAVGRDLRAILVLLAVHLVRLREAVKDGSSESEGLARTTRRVIAPIANRLGVWQLKWELEDLAFRTLEPETYRRLAASLDGRRAQREAYIEAVRQTLGRRIAEEGIEAQISGRPKHLYSIWRKMQRKGLGLNELFDLRAVRVLVDNVAQCYACLGITHQLWKPVPGEFDDYVAKPKPNGYRSLHTAVVGPEGKVLEVQIRTHRMHDDAELGVAAHWRYKEGAGADPGYISKVTWMRRLLGGDGDDVPAPAAPSERVYALTPRGKVIDLPAGATVLDFAYHVHTDVGHRCRGAKVNGRIVPLTREVAQGDQIEILTGPHPEPSRDWLNPQSGYLRGARSRQKVRQWFRRADFDRNREAGEDLVERELRRLGLMNIDLSPLARRHNFVAVDDLYAAVGLSEITVGHVARYAAEQAVDPDDHWLKPRRRPSRAHDSEGNVAISGVGDLLTTLARCCGPVPGEEILGYVTRGRGVTVHRRDCANVRRLQRDEAARVIDVGWRGAGESDYLARVEVQAIDRKGLLKDVTTVLAGQGADIEAVNTSVDSSTGVKRLHFDLAITGIDHLVTILGRIAALPNVLDCRRVPLVGDSRR